LFPLLLLWQSSSALYGTDTRRTVKTIGKISPRENLYRDVWIFILSAIVVGSLIIQNNQNNQFKSQQSAGRSFSIGVTCAVEDAVALAGEKVIVGNTGGISSRRFIRNLEKLGYIPPTKAQEEKVANLYVHTIFDRVRQIEGEEGTNLITKNGTLNCARLIRLSVPK
jgi:hypothetical protein